MDRHSVILDLCAATEHILYQIPLRVAVSNEEFFATGNLWGLEIESTCSQIIRWEYHRGVRALIGQGSTDLVLQQLSQGVIHEACFRFKYLAENEHELKDWTEWQITQDYKFARDSHAI